MKISQWFFLVTYLLTHGLFADAVTGNGKRITTQKKFSSFREVSFEGPFQVHLMKDKNYFFQISGDSNIVPLVEMKMNGEQLKIKLKGQYKTKHPIKLEIKMPNLNEVEEKGKVDVVLKDFDSESIVINSAGDNTLQGKSAFQSASLHMDGHGSFDLSQFQLQKIDIHAFGTGEIKVSEVNEVLGRLVGGIELFYNKIINADAIKLDGNSRLTKM